VSMKAVVYKDELAPNRKRSTSLSVSQIRQPLRASICLEEVSHYDDKLVELILEDAEIPEERLKEAIRKATLSTKVTPVLCGSSFKNKGVQPLLDCRHRLPAIAFGCATGDRHGAGQGRGGVSVRSRAHGR